LKERTDEDYEKIKNSIVKFGFSFPFFCWQNNGVNNILDGHGRLETLKRMKEEGYEIPELPVTYVKADSEKDAKDLLLRLNSNYGRMNRESVLDFIGDYDFDMSNYELPSEVITFDTDIDLDSLNDFFSDKPVDKTKDDNIQEEKLHEIKCPDCGRIIVVNEKFELVDEVGI